MVDYVQRTEMEMILVTTESFGARSCPALVALHW